MPWGIDSRGTATVIFKAPHFSPTRQGGEMQRPHRSDRERPKHHSAGLHSGSRHRIPNGADGREKWAMMQECAVRNLAASKADQWISRPTSVERLDHHPLLRIECAKHRTIEARGGILAQTTNSRPRAGLAPRYLLFLHV
ncbi:uncharacterized protein N7498_007743 [Penicillium cinerascens]|uniref:Uncharacterized protein n=1 Tax=Penicillium cinerascens TaxID=70096 RepID=A0A9W9MD14_9EURO|nr:uncharacterized protein N7498_007743 [Penicillium cinerascens]KAJ5198626.1 hypothetical protein N7498_007743 [Penicillium cinerascens]